MLLIAYETTEENQHKVDWTAAWSGKYPVLKTYQKEVDKVIFIFHLEDGFKRYEVEKFINNEVLELCEKLCDCKFESIKKMLSDNVFYGRILK